MKPGQRTLDDHAHGMNLGMKLYLMPEYYQFRKKFLRYAGIRPRDRILNFGCGVGLLEDLLIKRLSGTNRHVGVDIGKNLLRKAKLRFSACTNIDFLLIGASGHLPFRNQTFNLIVTNLVSHLLNREQKKIVYAEFNRILTQNGRLVMAEIGKPSSLWGKATELTNRFFWTKLWAYEKNSLDSYLGLVPRYLEQAGFKEVRVVDSCKGFIDFIVCTKT